jgi:hypothetical protein
MSVRAEVKAMRKLPSEIALIVVESGREAE